MAVSQEFLEMLKSRRESARRRLESARQAVAAAEADLRLWQSALETEQTSRGATAVNKGNSNEAVEHRQSITLTLTDARRKRDILKNALRAASKPVTTAQLVRLVSPAVSRASVYALVKEMKHSGEIAEDSEGRIAFDREQRSTTEGRPK